MEQSASAADLVAEMGRSGGGWWRALRTDQLLALYTPSDDTYYRAHHDHFSQRYVPASFSQARPAYLLGHVAGLDPDYLGRAWREVESELSSGWKAITERPWADVAVFAHAAFDRSSAAKQASWRTHLAESDDAWNAA